MLFRHDRIDYIYGHSVHVELSTLNLCDSGSAITHLPGCFCPWTFYLNIGSNMLRLDSSTSCLDCVLLCLTVEFQAFQLIVLLVFGVVDKQLASCMLVHFLEKLVVSLT